MEYRFEAVQELTTFINIFCIILTISFGIFIASVVFKRLEKFFVGSLLLTSVAFGTLIFLSNTNTYAESFDMKALSTLRYEAYGGIGVCLLIFVISAIYWRNSFKK